MLDEIQHHRTAILVLARRHGADDVRVFGSVLRQQLEAIVVSEGRA